MGCVRLVYNKALAAKIEGWYQRQERIDYKQTSRLLTGWKKTEDLDFLNEVSSVPLQQCLRNLQKAFANFWGKRAKYPRFKAKRNGGSAEFTKSAFKYRDGNLWLAKCQEPLNIVWSRLLPDGCSPSTVTVKLEVAKIHAKIKDARTDFLHNLTTNLVRANSVRHYVKIT
jgi:putative transposase